MPSSGGISPGRPDPLGPSRALDAGGAHQPAGLIATDVDPGPAGGLPELANSVELSFKSVTSLGMRAASLTARAEGAGSFVA